MDIPVVERTESPGSGRPLAVTLVASWEFAKAACAILIFSGLWLVHKMVASNAVSQDPLRKYPVVLVLPLVALYLIIVGFGIWNLMKWARWLLVPLIAYGAPRWAAFRLPPESDRVLLATLMPRPLALMVMALDIVAVLMLLRPEVRNAFGDIDADLP